jgi:hypothetical protein
MNKTPLQFFAVGGKALDMGYHSRFLMKRKGDPQDPARLRGRKSYGLLAAKNCKAHSFSSCRKRTPRSGFSCCFAAIHLLRLAWWKQTKRRLWRIKRVCFEEAAQFTHAKHPQITLPPRCKKKPLGRIPQRKSPTVKTMSDFFAGTSC